MDATAAQVFRFSVGSIRCTALADGWLTYPAPSFFADLEPSAAAAALAPFGHRPDAIPSPYTCLLVETAGRRVLLDTGGDGWDPRVGRLAESLALAGVDRFQIDVVVLTHGHPDHIGGTCDAARRAVYPVARHVMDRTEWACWTQPDSLSQFPEAFQRIAVANLAPLVGQIDLVDGEHEVAQGVRILPTPGHTPGHQAVVVEDAGEMLVYLSDAALHPLHLEHPEWRAKYDVDPRLATASRRRVLDLAARRDALVLAYHFDPFPCLGRLKPWRSGWRWEPQRERTTVLEGTP